MKLDPPNLRLLLPLMLCLCSVLLLPACGEAVQAQGGPQGPAPVSVAPVVQRTVSDIEEFSGRLEAAEFVELRPRIAGVIERVHFADGALVKQGQVLFTIDSRAFAAEVARAQSQLAAVNARSELAGTELARAKKLLEERAVSRQEYDTLVSSTRTSNADMLAAQAALRVARLNVEYATVRSPISGRISSAFVTAGNLVDPQVVLTSIAGVAKIHATFDGSERTFLNVRAAAAAGNTAPEVRMGLANEAGRPHSGKLDFIDNRLDPRTGAVRMRASFDNSKGQFVPGLAVRLSMATSAPYMALLVPERAIGTDQTKKFVVVVGSDGQPQFRDIQLGTQFGGMRAVQSASLKAGENIVVDGLQRVIPGVPVAPQVLKVDEQGMPIFPPPGQGGPGAPGGKG